MKNKTRHLVRTTRRRSVTRIKLKATTCVFLPTGKYISRNIFPATSSHSHLRQSLNNWQRAIIWRPRKLTASFQRKSDKTNTLRHKHKEIFFVIPSLWAHQGSSVSLERNSITWFRVGRHEVGEYHFESGTIGWKSFRCPALLLACRAAFAPWARSVQNIF